MRLILTGGAGMLGSSIAEAWRQRRPSDEIIITTRAEVDLTDRAATRLFLSRERPDTVIHAAAKVGGIAAKLAEPTSYLLDNLLIDSSLLAAAIDLRIPELLYVSSAAIYPEVHEQPLREEDVFDGPLESANEGYALAKIAAGKVCSYASSQFGLAYRVVSPSNLYGPHDHYGLGSAHLIAAALAKVRAAHVAGESVVTIWGDGTARREFTYAGDVAEWLVTQVGQLDEWPDLLNVGCGVDHSIREYYETAKRVIGYEGGFEYDASKPVGAAQRLLDSSRARRLGWRPHTSLEAGMAASYEAFLAARPDMGR